jgi:TonB family protein
MNSIVSDYYEVRRFRNSCFVLVFLILFIAASTTLCMAQDDSFSVLLPESYARESAIKKVLPSYPEEAVQRGISGVVRLKIEIGSEGEVLRIKARQHTDPLLKKAAADAARKWQFKAYPDRAGLGRSSLSRLTFMFAIRKGEALVKLYDPGLDAPDRERLGYYNSAKELREWKDWEEATDR